MQSSYSLHVGGVWVRIWIENWSFEKKMQCTLNSTRVQSKLVLLVVFDVTPIGIVLICVTFTTIVRMTLFEP